MEQQAIEKKVLNVLRDVAPNIDPDEIDSDTNFKDQFDFNSIDHLNLVLGIGKEFGFEIPETDYPKLSCLSGCVSYLARQEIAAA